MTQILISEETPPMRSEEEWKTHIANELRQVKTDLQENTELTGELVMILNACKGGFKVLGWIGVIIKWIGGVAIAITALITLWKAWKPL